MPFDNLEPAWQAAPIEIAIIDRMIQIFGANGEHWTVGVMHDIYGRHCLMGALDMAQKDIERRHGRMGCVTSMLLMAIHRQKKTDNVITFNDNAVALWRGLPTILGLPYFLTKKQRAKIYRRYILTMLQDARTLTLQTYLV